MTRYLWQKGRKSFQIPIGPGASLRGLLYHCHWPWKDSKGKLLWHQVLLPICLLTGELKCLEFSLFWMKYWNGDKQLNLSDSLQAHSKAHELWRREAAFSHCWSRPRHQGSQNFSNSFQNFTFFFPVIPFSTFSADMEHEDCTGGLVYGGPLAEGHREEPGGGGGWGERKLGSSSNPNPWLLSQGCSPI